MYKRILVTVLIAAAWASSPSLAMADTAPTGQVYISPDQVAPSQIIDVSFEIKNNSPRVVHVVSLQGVGHILTGTATINGTDTGGYSYYDSNTESRIDFGSFTNKLNLAKDATLMVTLHMNIGAIVDSNGNAVTDATLTNMHTWAIKMYTFDNYGGNAESDPTGNLDFLVTNTPHPSAKPLNFGVTNAYSNALTGAGLGSPTGIQGLFPAGPVDSIIVLPVTVLTQIFASANGAVITPSTTFFGRTINFTSGQAIWQGLGSTVTTLVSSGLAFFILLEWLRSLYHRLQRASSLDTHSDDTWGVL